jgi:hypothetical protein
MNRSLLKPLSLSIGAAAVVVLVMALSMTTSLAQKPPPPMTAPAPPLPKQMQVIDTSKPFSHDVHLSPQKMSGQQLACHSCHEMVNLDGTCPKAEVRFPKHETCAGCHQASFYTAPLTICTNCHQSAAFQKNNPLRELTRQITPRKAEFSHKRHSDKDCTTCHQFVRAGQAVSHPSHPNCCECHAGRVTPGGQVVQPTMNKCGDCHTASLKAGRPPSKIHSFSHKNHNTDPRTQVSMACKQCHVNMESATTLNQIRAPPMPVCVECHDGSDPNQPNKNNPEWRGTGAFHFSSCMKCHIPGSIKDALLPKVEPNNAGKPAPAAGTPK